MRSDRGDAIADLEPNSDVEQSEDDSLDLLGDARFDNAADNEYVDDGYNQRPHNGGFLPQSSKHVALLWFGASETVGVRC
jgi:hypothetical protein